MKARSLALAILTLVPLSAPAQVCKDNPKVVGKCFEIHGRVRVMNGAGIVIWHVGTNRILRVEDEDLIPANLSKAMSRRGDVYGRDVFGDFEVCPFTRSRVGEMQMICVESATHLVIRDNTH